MLVLIILNSLSVKMSTRCYPNPRNIGRYRGDVIGNDDSTVGFTMLPLSQNDINILVYLALRMGYLIPDDAPSS